MPAMTGVNSSTRPIHRYPHPDGAGGGVLCDERPGLSDTRDGAARPATAWRMACVGALLAVALGHAHAAGLEVGASLVLTVHYQHRPPYSEASEAGPPKGLLINRAAAALLKAGIAHHWVRTPGQRQFALIQSGQGFDCGLGWFRSPERESRGRFTRALYQDKPFMALVRRESGMQPLQPLSDWLGSTDLPLLVKDGYSYGPLLDARIAELAANDGPLRRTAAESTQMVRMIAAGRSGWMLSTPEEAEVLLREAPEVAQRLTLLPIAGMPAGNSRHLYCSLAVPESVIQRIDRALEEGR